MIFNNFGFNRLALFIDEPLPVPVPASAVIALDAGDPRSYPGSGSTWYDLSTNKNNANFLGSGMSYSTTGNRGGGFLNLAGNDTSTGSFLSTANIPSGNSSYTTTAWIKVSSNTRYNGWFGMGQQAESLSNSYRFAISSPNLLQNYWYSAVDFNIPFTPAVDSWYFITFTWNGSTANLYMRGAFTTSSVLNHTPLNVSTQNMKIGSDTPLNTPISGSMAFFRINNVALNSTEVTALYDATRARYGF